MEVREKLDLKPGTKMIVMAAEDAAVLQKAELLLTRESARGKVRMLKLIFSKLKIANIEEWAAMLALKLQVRR